MKMVKKILLGLAAGALVLGFAGCKAPEAGNADMITVKGSKGSISYTNESDTQVTRGFKPLKTKHLDAICHIQMTKKDLIGAGQVANGAMGYVFNLVEDDKAGTKSFSVAGIRYNQSKGLSAYVETFKDVPNDELETTALTADAVATGLGTYDDSPFGKIIANKSTVESKLKNGVLDVWIEVVANGKAKKTVNGEETWITPNGRDGTPGTYTVYFFLEDPKREKNDSPNNYELTYNGSNTRPADIGHAVVAADDVFMAYDSTKGLTSMQSYMGCYANVYKKQTLEGTWEFLEIKKETEEIEE